jgi:hypothetical protein
MDPKIKKEFKSFKNKLHGQNKIWFESLPIKSQFDILFIWKYQKYNNKLTKPLIKKVRGKLVKKYPINLKYFLKSIKSSQRFKVDKNKLRERIILNIFEENDN